MRLRKAAELRLFLCEGGRKKIEPCPSLSVCSLRDWFRSHLIVSAEGLEKPGHMGQLATKKGNRCSPTTGTALSLGKGAISSNEQAPLLLYKEHKESRKYAIVKRKKKSSY